MSSNFQGRKRGKSVSFRGQSNDSNFYERNRNDNSFSENRQRNQNRDQYNFESNDMSYNDESRTVKLLPDANMTISVANDYRAPIWRPRGPRGIIKSHSFRDDTHVFSRSSDYNDDYNGSSRRGFETNAFQGGRSRGRTRGFYNRYNPHVNKFAEDNQEEQFNNSNDTNFRGRSKSTSDRSRRGRSGRSRGRGRPFNRTSDDHSEGPTSGDGDKEDSREFSDNLDNYSENKTNENDVLDSPILPESCQATLNEEEQEKSEITKESETDIKSDTPEFVETNVKPVENQEVEEHAKNEEKDKAELS